MAKARQHWWCPTCKYDYESPVTLRVPPAHSHDHLVGRPITTMKLIVEHNDVSEETDDLVQG